MANLYPFVIEGARAMVFVDGENLSMRYGAAINASQEAGLKPLGDGHVSYLPNVAVWAVKLSPPSGTLSGTR